MAVTAEINAQTPSANGNVVVDKLSSLLPLDDETLDSALDALFTGQSISDICAQYPADTAKELQPLLHTAQKVREVERPTPDPEKKQQGREKLLAEIGKRQEAKEKLPNT